MVQWWICQGATFVLLAILFEVLNEHLSLLDGRHVPTKVFRVSNNDKPWFDDQCWHVFGLKQEAHLRWTRDALGLTCKSLYTAK